ncbi:MAG: hypothetical protein QM658_06945 [Gordonia sp. (in: high G+C Gram-positive bacteria)]
MIAEADHGLAFLDAAGPLADLSDAQVVAWWADEPVADRLVWHSR